MTDDEPASRDYIITVDGCDDSTSIRMALTDEQAALVKSIAEKITAASDYGCMPVMEIEPKDDE